MPNKQQFDQKLITRAEVASRLGVSPQSVDALVRRGSLPAPTVRSGRIVRFNQGEVERALTGGKA